MNLENIEVIANQACFSTNLNIKFQAEKLFMQFTFNLPIIHYSQILQKFSQTVVFVFLSYLDKKVPTSPEVIQIFLKLKSHALSWYQGNGQLKRNLDPQYLQNYVSNTLGMVLGKCMKYIFLNVKIKKNLAQYFESESNSLFKLFLYKHFIEVVSPVDNSLEYIQYRTLAHSFQQQMIPLFLNQLYPYFILITDRIKVDQLSHMLPNINESSVRARFDLFRLEDKPVCNLVFCLLSQIMMFKFNITITEYDLETQLQNCMVSFPQSILRHITSKQFLQAFYFMLEKMVLLNYTGPNFGISFECLKRILLSKITHLNPEQRIKLTRIHYYGLCKITQIQTFQHKILIEIFECAFKFVHAYQFSDLSFANVNHLQWLSLVKSKTLSIIKQVQLNNDSQLFHSICKLISKIASLSITMSQQKHINFYQQMCRDFYRIFFDQFVSRCQLIFGKVQIQKILSLQTILSGFFNQVNRIGSMDMGFMLNLIGSRVEQILSSQNAIKIANLIFLVTQIIEENYYDRSIVFETTADEDLKILGMIINRVFHFVDFYKKNKLNSSSSSELIDIAIMLFFQKILNECLGDVTIKEGELQQLQILAKTYKIINSYQSIPTTDQAFLLFCFKQLGQAFRSKNYQKVEYALETFQKLSTKLKWAVKRQALAHSQISKQILNIAFQLSKDSLLTSSNFLKQRIKLFKIITILSFDDTIDSYRTNIDYVVQSIEHDYQNNQIQKLVFDLTGICENITAPIIYKYLLTKLDQKIGLQLLIKTFYEVFCANLNMLSEVVFLNKVMITDKTLRMSAKQLSIFIYNLIDISIPFLTQILEVSLKQQWNEVVRQVFSFVNSIVESSSINLYILKRKNKQNLLKFVYRLIENILKNQTWIQLYPELSEELYQIMENILKNCSQLILTWQQQSAETKHQVLLILIQLDDFAMNLCQKHLQQLQEGGKSNKICDKLLSSIANIYSFIRQKKVYIHKGYLIQNINFFVAECQNRCIRFIQSLYKFGMSNIKNRSNILNSICIAIMELSYIYKDSYKIVFLSLGIEDKKIKDFERIYLKILSNEKDSFFTINLKQWLAKSQSNYQPEYNY